jgi:hypothetical protein
MTTATGSVLLAIGFALIHPQPLSSQDHYASDIMMGIGNQGENGGEPYVTAGDRAYLIGTQDGEFPDLGGHVPGEMGGLWLHPIKLIDGFWATVSEGPSGPPVGLSQTKEFINYPYGNRFKYRAVLEDLEIERLQFSPDGHPGIIVQYSFTNAANRERELTLQLSVRTDLLPVWFSERLGITDAPDSVAWQPDQRRFLARDTRHSWFAVWGATPAGGAEPVTDPQQRSAKGMGVTAASRHTVTVPPHGASTLTFVFAGSSTSRLAADAAFTRLVRQQPNLLENKQAYYASLTERARIRIPDRRLQQVYNWVRINAEWMVRDVPGIGRGLGGGLMEYPWWFGTETYSLQALAASGNANNTTRGTTRLPNEPTRIR